jgi:hypothetical protein
MRAQTEFLKSTNGRDCVNTDTTGLQRVVSQLQPKGAAVCNLLDTTDFCRVEFSVSAFFNGANLGRN